MVRPFSRQIGEASNPHTVRETAVDGRLDEIGGPVGGASTHVLAMH